MKFIYQNDLSELDALNRDLNAFGKEHALSENLVHAFNLCLDELFTNVVSYGYDDEGLHQIEIEIVHKEQTTVATIRDDGRAFNPLTEAPEPDLESPLEVRREGGLGVFFLKEMMDELEYRRVTGKNELTMVKKDC